MKNTVFFLLCLFSLSLFADGEHLRLAIFTDVHLNKDETVRRQLKFAQSEAFLDTVIREINATPDVDLAVNCGDLANHSFQELERGAAKLGTLRHPLLNLAGNHDYMAMLNGKKSVPDLAKALGVSSFASGRVIGKWRIVALDESPLSFYRYRKGSPEYQKMQQLLPARFGKFDLADGALPDTELQRLEKELAAAEKAGQKVILLSHSPIEPNGRTVVHRIQNSDAVMQLLRKYSHVVRFAVSGHIHGGSYAVRGNTGMLSVKGLIEAKKPTWVLLDLYPDCAVITGHGDEPNRNLVFASSRKDPRAAGFCEFYSPLSGFDPERAGLAIGCNYQKAGTPNRISYYELREAADGKALRIVSRGDGKIAKGTQWSHFRSYLLPKGLKKLKIEFKFALKDPALKMPQFMVSALLPSGKGDGSTVSGSVQIANSQLMLNFASVEKGDFSRGSHTLILEVDVPAGKVSLFRKGENKPVAVRSLTKGPKEPPQVRWGDGSGLIFGEAELYYIGWKY